MSSGLVAVLVIAGIILCIAGALFIWVNRPMPADRSYATRTLPLFGSDVVVESVPLDSAEQERDEPPLRAEPVGETKSRTPADIAALVNGKATTAAERAVRFAPPPDAVPVSSLTAPRPTAQRASVAVATPTAAAPAIEGTTVRFAIPGESTMQFLPGRLEITAGEDIGREVRFVRVPGDSNVRISFGRLEGAPYRHVQLRVPTVSRMHAEMTLDGERWNLTNLSTTNPVVCNDRVLASGESLVLEDGDRIEMGEVVFRFRSH